MNRPKKPRSFYEMSKTVRGDWNGINSVTKVFRDKTKYTRKEKHKNKDYG